MKLVFALIVGATIAGPGMAQEPAPGDVAAFVSPDQTTTFTLISQGGYVRFSAQPDWAVIAMQSQLPVTVTAFQLADPADAGTPDSTNLAVSLYQPSSPEAMNALAAMGRQMGDKAPVVETYSGWTVYTQEAMQGETTYTDMDATSSMADVKVSVRLAWPHLAGHTDGYDDMMRALFLKELDSVNGATGAYKVRDGEVVRRPDAQ